MPKASAASTSASASSSDWPGRPNMRSRLTSSNSVTAAAAAARASSAPCTRPSAARKRGSKLCTPIDSRFTPAARKPSKRASSNVPGIRLHRDLGVGGERQPRAHRREQTVDRRGREERRRAAAEEHARHLASPHRRQRALEVGDERVDVRVLRRSGRVAAPGVRVEVAVRALRDAPRQVHVQRQRRQRDEAPAPGIRAGAIDPPAARSNDTANVAVLSRRQQRARACRARRRETGATCAPADRGRRP